MTTTVTQISETIEKFAPLNLQEHYDNSGLQIGNPENSVTNIMVCLSITEDIINEAIQKKCQMIVSHHPLIFRPLKQIIGQSSTEVIVAKAIKHNIVIYSAHTNLDVAYQGVSYQMAHKLGMTNLKPLQPTDTMSTTGLGIIGEMPDALPKLEFLRLLKKAFNVKTLRYGAQASTIVIKKIALCGGSGASLIENAKNIKVDAYVSGDLKYHDFDSYGTTMLLVDIGHFESELLSRNLLAEIILENHPNITVMISETETNPIKVM